MYDPCTHCPAPDDCRACSRRRCEENQSLRGSVNATTLAIGLAKSLIDAKVAGCCGPKSGKQFCESYGCESLMEIRRALALADNSGRDKLVLLVQAELAAWLGSDGGEGRDPAAMARRLVGIEVIA